MAIVKTNKSLAIIVAMDVNQLIGNQNNLPWHLPADLIYFKKNTLTKTIIMGRKTYQSIGKALPNRRNIVISRQKTLHLNDAQVAPNLPQAIALAEQTKETMIIGGASIYQQALPLCQTLYITHVHHTFSGDTYFPNFIKTQWQLISEDKHQSDDKNHYDYTFSIYKRKAL